MTSSHDKNFSDLNNIEHLDLKFVTELLIFLPASFIFFLLE